MADRRDLQDADQNRRYATSHLTVLWLRVELLTVCRSLVWLTVSKPLEKSMASITVRCSGFGWLKPVATLGTSGNRAEVVERSRLKPCWETTSRR